MIKNTIGNLSFYNADCMDILKQTPDKYYDLAIVDPPVMTAQIASEIYNQWLSKL